MTRLCLTFLCVALLCAPAAAQPPRTDAHGDPLPDEALARLGSIRLRHGAAITTLAFSADGRVLLSAANDNTLRLWDADGKLIRAVAVNPDTPAGPSTIRTVQSAALAPDGKSAAAFSAADQTLRVWEVSSGKVLVQAASPGLTLGLTFSPDGKSLAFSRSDRKVHVWDAATLKPQQEFAGHTQTIGRIAFAADGKTLATASYDRTVRLWDRETGKELRQWSAPVNVVQGLGFSADGKTLAAASPGSPNGWLRVWDTANGDEVKKLDAELASAGVVTIAADAAELVSAFPVQKKLRGWDLGTLKPTRELDLPATLTLHMAVSPDRKRLALATSTYAVLLWDLTTGQPVKLPEGHTAAVYHLAFAPDGKTLISGASDLTARRWSADGKSLGRTDLPGNLLGVSSITAMSVGPDGTARLIDLAGEKEPIVLKPAATTVFQGTISADGRTAAVAASDGKLTLWNAARGELRATLDGRVGVPRAMAMTPDGETLATLESDSTLRLWDAASGRERLRASEGVPTTARLSFSADGRRLLVSSSDSMLRVFETATGKRAWTFTGLGTIPYTAAVSPDGRLLAAGGRDGPRIFDLLIGKERGQFKGHVGDVVCLAFAPDGRTLASGGGDATTLLWDLSKLPPVIDPATRDLDALWAELLSPEAAGAQAVTALAAAPERSVPYLMDRLKPAGAADSAAVDRLIADLESEDVVVARKAMTELERLGRQAESGLRKRLESPAEVDARLRMFVLLSRMGQDAASPEGLRNARAVQALEYAGTAAARDALTKLTEGAADAALTREARSALDRLDRRTNPK